MRDEPVARIFHTWPNNKQMVNPNDYGFVLGNNSWDNNSFVSIFVLCTVLSDPAEGHITHYNNYLRMARTGFINDHVLNLLGVPRYHSIGHCICCSRKRIDFALVSAGHLFLNHPGHDEHPNVPFKPVKQTWKYNSFMETDLGELACALPVRLENRIARPAHKDIESPELPFTSKPLPPHMNFT